MAMILLGVMLSGLLVMTVQNLILSFRQTGRKELAHI